MREAVRQAQATEEASERARDRSVHMLAVVAHELRGPLGPMRNAAAVLGCERPVDAHRARLIIERQIAVMSRMIDDLLDLSRANSGKLGLVREQVRLDEIIDRAVEACAAALGRRRQRLLVSGSASGYELNADPLRLLQILGNLLENASKYSPVCNAIYLDIHVLESCVTLIVRDHGIGIPKEALGRIFEPFTQESRAAAFDRSGLGVGLAVVRELVEAHGGTIVVNSEGIGHGACFVVNLPRCGNEP